MTTRPFYLAVLLFFLVAVATAADTLPKDNLPPSGDEENCPQTCGDNAKCIYTLTGWACVCDPGYDGDATSYCTDIDECSADPSPCDVHASCENTEGGYVCTCHPGYEGDGKTCIQATKGVFPAIVQHEDQVEVDDGREGLFLELRGGDTIEINQLQATQYVDPGWAVKRKGGGLVEAEVFYDIPAEMNAGHVGTFVITYNAVDNQGNQAETRERTVRVLDIDECEQNLHSCSVHATCVNTDGGYECECKTGFTGDGFKCSDVNECKLGTAECHAKADCTNTIGSYLCTCKEGYEGDGISCVNIDECKNPVLNKCDPNAECTDTEGSFECKCRDGFQGTGFVCEPVDSCTHQRHDCHEHATCHTANNDEGFICICKTGFVGNGKQCTDLDECQDPDRYTCSEHSTCVNHEGGYECVCDKGFEKADDGYSCVDVDECVREIDDCSPHANCTNTEGSFECVCKEGYTGDGKKCVPVSTPPDIELRGPNPVVMHACDPYREEGFTISDTKKATLRVSVAVPPALMEDPVMTLGTFQIRYIVTDQEEHRSVQLRNVTVERVDPCSLPEGHRCRHKCHPWARCVSSDISPFYTCTCGEGYATSADESGNAVCTDNSPPTIMLVGPEVVTLRACRVCNWFDRGENYDERKHGGFHAFDTLPDGRQINLDNYVTITNETIVPDKEWKIYYDVKDAAGNPALTKVRVVKKEVEDILRRIETIEKFLNQKFAEFEPYEKQIDFLTTYSLLLLRILGVAIGLVLVIYLVPRLINMLRVMFVQDTPTFEEYSDAYDLWFALTRPWVRTSERARMVQIQYQRQFRDK